MALFTSCMPFQYIRSWRKASKCKKIIDQVLYRLKFIQARKSAIVTQTREDISMLLKLDQFQLAVKLAGELHREQTRIAAYEIVNEICECISKNVSRICKTRDLPTDANVAVSSLIFAASRCGELPELNKLRNLFRDWFGNQFDATNVNLLSSNMVKSELKRTLSTNPISDTVKLKLVDEIMRDSSVTAHPQQNGQVINISGEKAVVEDTRETGTVADRKVRDDLKLELLLEMRLNSTCQALRLRGQQVHEERVGKTMQKPESVCPLENNLSPRESTDTIYQIPETEIVYLDDVSGNASSRNHDTPAQVPFQNSRTHRRCTPLCSSISIQPLPQHTPNPKRNKPTHCRRQSAVNATEPVHKTRASRKLCQGSQGQIKNCIHHQRQSAVSGLCKGHRRRGDNSSVSSLSHVHPNLPQYEDLEANLKDHRRQCQNQ